MLSLIPDLPPGVVGVEAHGEVSADDYEQVLVPAVEAAHAAAPGGKVRILYVFEGKPDLSTGAAWQDARLGLRHVRDWERIAVVSDADWLRRAIHGLAWMIPGDVRVFGTTELDAARSWVTA